MANRTFQLNKLVRDGILESTEAIGGVVYYETVQGVKKADLLIDKLFEEIQEFDQSRDVKELAQILGIFGALATELGFSKKDLVTVEEEKQRELGGYVNGIFVKTITLPETSEWVAYYASEPDRFPEITG